MNSKTMTKEGPSNEEDRSIRRIRDRIPPLGNYTVPIGAAILYVVLATISQPFLTATNQFNILDQWSALAIIACGSTVCIVAGGFDLSVNAVFVLSGVVAAKVVNSTSSVELGLACGLATGLALGTANGLLVTVGRVNPFIATIASSVAFLGAAQLVTGGSIVVVDSARFSWLGTTTFGNLTLVSLIFIVFAIMTSILMSRTTVGRRIYAVGGNYEAARFSGIAVGRVQIFSYSVSGFSAGLAGVLAASRNSSAQADLRVDLAFQAITAVVIGGVSIFGGEGTIPRALVGVLILALIGNGFNLLNVDDAYQQLLLGLIIVSAVAADAWSRKTTT